MQANWNWLLNTYWYVPENCLAAPSFMPGTNEAMWMNDQTVWQITGYQEGYFWGNVAAIMQPRDGDSSDSTSSDTPSAQYVKASITPGGHLHMTFSSVDTSNSTTTIGLGNMVWLEGNWAAQMQMSTNANGMTILHWANMLQCKPGDPAWQQLPGTDQSLPEFLTAAGFSVA